MTHALKSARCRMALIALFALSWLPAHSRADMPDAADVLDYGFKGFTLGIEAGLAVGYLSTGRVYDEQDWRTLVLGMGIGALAGVTTGVIVSVADVTSNGVPVGYYMLRDSTYGTLIGAVLGGVVGGLLWVDDGTSRDLLQGAAYGTLFGAVAGIAYGIVEGANSQPMRRRYGEWRVSLSPYSTGRDSGLAAHVAGKF
jgi:hypothetical protein